MSTPKMQVNPDGTLCAKSRAGWHIIGTSTALRAARSILATEAEHLTHTEAA